MNCNLMMSGTYLSTLLALTLTASSACAEVTVPNVLGSHMVIQRDAPVRIWGWADADESVTVTLGDRSHTSTANADGNWQVELPAQTADGQPRTITIAGSNTITLTDVLVGEVWLGSGQSNMEWPLRASADAEEAIATADRPQLRLFHVPKKSEDTAARDIDAEWRVCSPESVADFSAVLYYYGIRLQEELDVPVGLINSSWGGTAIEPWTTTEESTGPLYNAMVAPLTNVSIRGTIWYQGETNVLNRNGFEYAAKMKDLITGWRKAFRNEHMPFYYVQIAPWSGGYEPGQLPAVWEAQTATLNIPYTGMVVTTDLVDNLADIHPRNKKDVGYRLALWALAGTYGREGIVFSGPIYKSMEIKGMEVRIEFHYTADGLKARDDQPLNEFQIAGADGKFVDAVARIDGNAVMVSSPNVAEPTQVRFGWRRGANPNLVNSAGLPASPFRTHEWRGAIAGRD